MKFDRIAAGALSAAILLLVGLPPARAGAPRAGSNDAAPVRFSGPLTLREEGAEHARYLDGNASGMFEPSKALTRAEAAQIFYSLLDGPPQASGSFPDVPEDAAYAQAVGTLARAGAIPGDEDGRFRPNAPLTRADCAVAAAYFLPAGGFPFQFDDLSVDDPYYGAVCAAVSHRLFSVSGGSFHPDDPLTRAEAAVVFNRLLGRSPDPETIASAPEVRFFPDVPATHWAYAEIMEATIGHTQEPDGLAESWLSLDAERNPLSDGFHNIGGSLYCVQDGKFVRDTTVRGFPFGSDGRMTTGDPELDDLLAEIVRTHTNSSMSNAQKLRAMYAYVRDNFTYIKRNLVSKGQTGWEPAYAEAFLHDGRGNCFGFAATFCLLARELGYNAHTVVGWLGQNRQEHGWVEITIDGRIYVYDAQLEMKYSSLNFFQARYGDTRFDYFKNP